MSKLFGGWSMSLSKKPLTDFDIINYGMVTNLSGLTTGSAESPGWSPEKSNKPDNSDVFNGKTLWTYGGGGCSPAAYPQNESDVARIVNATVNNGWDGVDFDDECSMNIPLVIETMTQLKAHSRQTSFGFISGSTYNSPDSDSGARLNEKVQQIASSGQCDRLIHYCYASRMWSDQDITNNVAPALKRSIDHGMEPGKIILALTTRGLTDWNLNYFLEQVSQLQLGGLFVWLYEDLTADNIAKIKAVLSK